MLCGVKSNIFIFKLADIWGLSVWSLHVLPVPMWVLPMSSIVRRQTLTDAKNAIGLEGKDKTHQSLFVPILEKNTEPPSSTETHCRTAYFPELDI